MIMDSIRILFIALCVAFQSHICCSQTGRNDGGDCSILVANDLVNAANNTAGIIPSVLGGVPVVLIDFELVCLSSGTQRDTYRSVSVIARYQRLDNGTTHRDQFTFDCSPEINVWVPLSQNNPDEVLRDDPQVIQNVNVTLDTNCGLCINPQIGEVFNPDSLTFCASCPESCLGLCTDPFNGASCCNFYDDNMCVTNCSPLQISDSNSNCVNSGFTIDGVFLPASAEEEPFYVYEVSGSSPSPPPLTVTCFLGGSESWMYDFGGTFSNASLCPCDVGAGEVITTMGAVLTHTPGPTIPVIYLCSNGMNLIMITIVPALPRIPDSIVLFEGEALSIDCTPPSPNTTVSFFVSGFLVPSNGPVFTINSVVLSDSGTYNCTAYSDRLTQVESVQVTVLPASSNGLEIINEGDTLPDNFVDTDLGVLGEVTVSCVGSDGNGRLVWSSEDNRVRQQLTEIAGQQGTFFVQTSELNITVVYFGGNTANLTVTADLVTTITTITFKCTSRESEIFKYTLFTSEDSFYRLFPTTNLMPSLGQAFNITFQLVQLGVPTLIGDQFELVQNGTPIEGAPILVQEGPQLYHIVYSAARLSDSGNYFLVMIDSPVAVSFEIIVSIPSLSTSTPAVVSQKEGEPLVLTCDPSNPLVQVEWLYRASIETNEGVGLPIVFRFGRQFELSPTGLNHRLTFRDAASAENGVFHCRVRDDVDVLVEPVTISVSILRRCDESYSAGVYWTPAFTNDVQRVRCNTIDPRFSLAVKASRQCGDAGVWSDVDFSNCTLLSLEVEPFLLLWVQTTGLEALSPPSQGIVDEITAGLSSLEDNYSELFIASSASLTSGSRDLQAALGDNQFIPVRPAIYRVNLNLSSADINVDLIRNNYVSTLRSLPGIDVFPFPQNQGAVAFMASEECDCHPYIFSSLPPQGGDPPPRMGVPLQRLCTNAIVSPCDCTSFVLIPREGQAPDIRFNCRCTNSFLGDGQRCVADRDDDGYPDIALSTCPEISVEPFCQEDTCPTIYNLPQSDIAVCTPGSSGGIECPLETDSVYGFQWGYTPAGSTVFQPCGQGFTGNASRVCDVDGVWIAPNASECSQIAYEALQAISLFLQIDSYSTATAQTALDEVMGLVDLTAPQQVSIVPSDLNVAAEYVLNTVDYLLSGLENINENDTLTLLNDSPAILEVLSNIINTNNLPGTLSLDENNPQSTFSQNVLNSAERYGLYLSSLLEQQGMVNREMVVATDNLILNAQSLSVNDIIDLTFPPANIMDLINGTSNTSNSILDRLQEVSITIPASVLRDRAVDRGRGSQVRVSNIIIQNLQQLLPSVTTSDTMKSNPVSVILSSAVEGQGGDVTLILPDPVTMTFTAVDQEASQTFSCAFFDFNNPVDIGSFSDSGVTTESVVASGNDSIVDCSSTHLTSFAVLVNVAGNNPSSVALSVISYIGIALSLLCLIPTIIFFLSFGKELFNAVHNFVHLNLAIALFLAYLTFALGVTLAARNEIACKFVTALLHYLFLAVFCWMLCEGVMLYLMLWVIFTTLSKKWWFFLLLGWVPPVVFVIIGLGSVLDEYGVYNNGTLQFCWLSSTRGTHAIWTFVAPMLAIIVINSVFLILVLVSLFRSLGNKNQHKKSDGKRLDLVKSIIKASLILLPLLGLTWVIGLFAVNMNTEVFAWIFTILNTLQGVSIFVLHVLRHEKVWGRFKKKYHVFEFTSKTPTNSQQETYKKRTDFSSGNDSQIKVHTAPSKTEMKEYQLIEKEMEERAGEEEETVGKGNENNV